MSYVVIYLFTSFSFCHTVYCCTKGYFYFCKNVVLLPLIGTLLQNIKFMYVVYVCSSTSAWCRCVERHRRAITVVAYLCFFISLSCDVSTRNQVEIANTCNVHPLSRSMCCFCRDVYLCVVCGKYCFLCPSQGLFGCAIPTFDTMRMDETVVNKTSTSFTVCM